MAPRIAEEIWEQYRDEIIALYCAPKPEGTLKKTMQTMKEKHGKSQYTTKFEAWGLQKYADSTIWAYADQKTRKRKLEEDKDTGLIIHGRKRTPQEIEREIARNVTHTSRLQLLQDIPTPEGVQAFTPGAAVSSTSVAFREVCTSNLPSVQLHKMIHQLMCKNPQVYKFDSFSTIDNLDISVQSNSQLNSSNSPPSAAESQQRPLRDIVDSAMSSILRDSLSKRRMSLASYFPPDGIDNDWMLLSNQLEGFDTQFALPNLLQYFIGLTNNGVIIGSQLQKGVEWILTNLSESFLSDLFSLETTAIRTFMRKILPAVVTCGNTKVVECIIEKSIDILSMANHRKRDGYTQQEECMSIAITNGDSRMVELLCTAGFSPQIVSQFFPPHPKTLWDTENLGALHILLSLGADPECFISNQPRGYPLMDAAKSGNLEAVKMLVKKGSRVNPIWQAYIGSPLQAAVWAGHLEIAEFLIGCGANINAPFGTQYQMLPANDWAECRNCYAGECLCQIHMSMYWSMKTPIEIACARNNVSLAGLLVTHGANVDLCSIQQIEEFLMFCSPRDGPYSIYSPHRNKIHFLSALQHSVHNGNITLVRLLLTNGANPDARGILDWGDTPLQLSIRLGYTEIAQILIAHGANVNASPGPYNGRTAIQAAAESGNIQLAQMLLKKGARINAPPGHERGLTALQAAIKMGHPLMAGFLCLSGADIDAYPATEQGITAIQAAAEIGDLNLINDLVRQGAYMDNTAAGNRAIVASILHKNLPMVKLFVKHGAPINGQGKDDDMLPIVTSVMIGWIDGVRYLLDNGADINSYQYEDKENDNISPLAWSIINHDIDMIKLLLKRGASLRCPFAKSPYNDSLCLALYKRCSMKIIDKLINEYIKEDPFSLDAEVLATAVCNEYEDHGRTRTETILNAMSKLPETSYVAQVRNAWNKLSECRGYLFGSKNMSAKLAEQVIKLLLQAGADINNRHPWMRCTLLQTAVERKNTGIAKVLIEEGADIQGLTSNSIGTPLQIAIRYNETDFAHFLLERGADINAPPAENSIGTALQAAVSNGNKPLVSKLLERGAEVNAPSAGCYGLTALHEAANGGYIGIAIDLLRHGALVAAPALTKYGKTAIDAAAGHGHEDMLQLLLNHYDGCEDLSVVCERAAIYAEKEGHCEIASWLRQYPSLSTDGE